MRSELDDYEIQEDTGLLFDVFRNGNRVSGKVRVCGRVVVDGVEYVYDREVRVSMTKWKGHAADSTA